jgi:polar amino acid transport system substrate-binding protein
MNKLSTAAATSDFSCNQRAWMEVIFSNIGDGVVMADEKGHVIFVNAIVKKILKIDDKDIINKLIDDFVREIRIKVNEENECISANKSECTLNGRYDNNTCINIFTQDIKNSADLIIGKVAIVPNIAECDKAHQIIHKMAHYDSLTGLANRALINESLDNILAEAKETQSKAAVAFIDLDNFKLINDTMGHDVGDVILRKASEIIEGCFEDKDFAGRLGGDEFIVVMPKIKKISEAMAKINKLVEEINTHINIDQKESYISASVGIAIYPDHGEDSITLIKNADAAMYIAKGNGKNSFKLFNAGMNIEISKKVEMINNLRNAIKNNEFALHYQPQIDINTNSIIGMEALVRWNHPVKGIIPPLDFIPLAEETGLILQIGEWVLNEACRQNKEWQDLGYKPMRVSVNLSIVQFEHKNLIKLVKNALNKTGLMPKWLELEITESVTLKCYDCAVQKLNELKKIGVYVSLDDFGTGYSSFNYLKQLPIDTLKIDKIFLDNLIPDSDEEFIMKTMINLARKLKLTVVAEGVESIGQLEFLKKEKCNTAQGFLFSKPLSKLEFVKLISNLSNYDKSI